MTMRKIILVSAALILICQFGLAEPHTWTFNSGITFPGEFVSATTNSVIIMRDGRNFSITIANLSDADNAYIKKKESEMKQMAFEIAMQQADFRKRRGEQYEHVVMISTNRTITITAIFNDGSNAGLPLCSVKGLDKSILIKDLPGNVFDFVNSENDLADKINRDAKVAAQLDAVAPQSDASVATTIAVGNENVASATTVETPQVTPQRAQANLAAVNVAAEQRKLGEMQATLSSGTVIAFPSAETFGGYQVWYCDQK
jgi:hypothetical protein